MDSTTLKKNWIHPQLVFFSCFPQLERFFKYGLENLKNEHEKEEKKVIQVYMYV